MSNLLDLCNLLGLAVEQVPPGKTQNLTKKKAVEENKPQTRMQIQNI